MLGTPLPLAENPIRLAEELAMIDMISKGRLVSGFVRGGGQEQLAAGVNPAFNRERFEEAHDLVVKARSEEHTSELQSHSDLVCRLLLEKKKKNQTCASLLCVRSSRVIK